MNIPTNHRQAEDRLIQAVLDKELEIDPQGRVWRISARRGIKGQPGATRITKVTRCRADRLLNNGYLQVRVAWKGKRICGCAHRLVWRHRVGKIPPGMTINHKNGNKTDNRLGNLELATYSEQMIHCHRVLKKSPQHGTHNPGAKLTDAKVRKIRTERASGATLLLLAEKYGVSYQTISKVALGKLWKHIESEADDE